MSSADGETIDVTVLIPAFNRADLLPRAIESVFAQTGAKPVQILVVDDGSEDDTAAVAERLGVEVIRHHRNRGLPAARNTGMEAALGEWVALLDSDDEWMPNHLGNAWASRPGHVVVAQCAIWLDADGHRRLMGAADRVPIVIDSPARLLFPENFVPASSTVLHRETALAVGGYDESLPRVEDLDLLVRMLERGTCAVLPDAGVIYYGHEGQMSGNRGIMRQTHREVIESYRGRDWWSPRLLELWDGGCRWDDARAAAREGRRLQAARIFAGVVAHPAQMVGIAQLVSWRRRIRGRLPEVLSAIEPSLPAR
ncbi:MAG TPA: glycosyltransferase [Solirubrobacterales bacterium]|nr:glycosyltransferase [Solirubrobacterales bacterium]